MASTNKTDSTCKDILPTDPCSICLEEMKPGLYAYTENCGHYFHHSCLTTWFCQGMTSCPMCRADFRRILLWPETIESQRKKSIIFELQKRCFGLFNVSPQTDICVTHLEGMVSVEIQDAQLLAMCTTEDREPTYEPVTELDIPDLKEFKLQFRMEDCEHVFPSDQLQSQLTKLRRTGKVACSTCDTESMHLLLEPEYTYFQEIEHKIAIFQEQKWCFCKEARNHNLVIEELSNRQFSVRIDGWQHVLNTDTLTVHSS